MAQSLLTANSFAELEQVPGLGAALDRPLAAVLSELVAPVEIHAQLVEVARSGVSLRGFLHQKEVHRRLSQKIRYAALLGCFKQWLARHPAGPSRQSAATATADPAIAQLIARSRVPDLGRWEANYFLDESATGTLAMTLDDLATVPKGLPRRLRDDIVHNLGTFVAALDRARRDRNPLVRQKLEQLPSTGKPVLDAFRNALAERRIPLLDPWPNGLFEAYVQVGARGETLSLQIGFEGDRPEPHAGWSGRHEELIPTVTLPDLANWARAPTLGCTCGRPACIHRALALDSLIIETEDPASQGTKLALGLLQPRWEQTLHELQITLAPVAKVTKPAALSVVVGERQVSIYLHEMGKKGKSKSGKSLGFGRAIPWGRLSGLDLRIAELWALRNTSYRDRETRFIGDVLLVAESHPDVRLEPKGPAVPLRVSAAHVALEQDEAGVTVKVKAGDEVVDKLEGYDSSRGFLLVRRKPDQVVVYTVAKEVQRLLQTMGRNRCSRFPKEALPSLAEFLPRLESAARVELPEELRGKEEPASARPVVRVDAETPLVSLGIRCEPLAGGPLFVPGQGVPQSAAFDGAHRRFARRDFEAELSAATAVAAELGFDLSLAKEPFTWALEPGDKGVESLRRVSHLADRGVAVEWKGPRPKFTRPAELKALSLRVEKKRDWFGLEGELAVDDRRVALAALLEAARARRRWVALGKDDYAELSEELLHKLAPLAHLKGDEPSPTLTLGTVPLIEALAQEVQAVEAVDGWKKLTQRLAAAKARDYPLPQELAPVLRDYQREGFAWLSRLADWGAGACLADDMGLGKTLQALALLVSRQALGPALVVAPSSVLHTWKMEAARFAPGLKVRFFHESDRSLAGCRAGELLVVSWTLLAREAELFEAQPFATVVLDEAQAIKNAGTLRARAAHRLKGDFVVALSGTPIENHIGELWSLFRAVMPALLGSEESFRRRFASAAPEAVRALSELVRPFILRRNKSEVAKELPPRTDLDVLVPLSQEERALYDDVRLAAVAELGELTGESKRFDVLAALTRLRLAACHPKLVDKGWKGGAAKLSRLLELLKDLGAAGHKALVFSQFTQHLALVSDALHREGVVFSYLDGQVPLAERQRRVEAFQAGKGGDIFLISLKAGGTGLTLTAADYVLHLDPWWNPAVEDQASDRAHRIGQDKPVTVYRLISEGTVEQQILSLHQEKRELVDALLSGADQAGKLSAAELLALIRQEQ